MRDTTERPEGVLAGTARLVGTDRDRVAAETFQLLDNPDHCLAMSHAHNPFGDGHEAIRMLKYACYGLAFKQMWTISEKVPQWSLQINLRPSTDSASRLSSRISLLFLA